MGGGEIRGHGRAGLGVRSPPPYPLFFRKGVTTPATMEGGGKGAVREDADGNDDWVRLMIFLQNKNNPIQDIQQKDDERPAPTRIH